MPSCLRLTNLHALAENGLPERFKGCQTGRKTEVGSAKLRIDARYFWLALSSCSLIFKILFFLLKYLTRKTIGNTKTAAINS